MRLDKRKNQVKEMIAAGKPAVGTFLLSRSIADLEILALVGYDFVVIDTEHFMKNDETIEHLIIAAEANEITPFVRVQENPHLIERALSAGARGIVLPMCNTVQAAKEAVEASKYTPIGKRGMCNTRVVTYGASGIEDMAQYFATENDNVMLIVQIETLEGVSNLDAIIEIEGIDMIFIGPLDLSGSLGRACDFANPSLEERIQGILAKTKAVKIPIGIATFDATLTNERIKQGFSLIALAADTLFLAQGARQQIQMVQRS
jgi:2-keto-3-deoxy-L-rhamnonate aldolase RhmA